MSKRDIILVGGSAGSTAVLVKMAAALPADLPASLFVSTHIQAHAPGYLAERLANDCRLKVSEAFDGQPVEQGRIYIAPPDRHLLVLGDVVRLGYGPRENMARPAIDPMFRSGALMAGPRAVGVLLSGNLNDGVAGLAAIHQRGGTTVVQHPADALVDQMPRAALQQVEVDHVVRAADLAGMIERLSLSDAGPSPGPTPPELELEVRIAAGARLGAEKLAEVSTPSALSCPNCHGVLSEMKVAGPLRFRCQTGHAFTAEAALLGQQGEIDDALRIALRVVEERLTLVRRMAAEAKEQGRKTVAELYEHRASEYEEHVTVLRRAATLSMQLAQGEDEDI